MNDWSRPYNQSGRSSISKGSPTLMMQQLGWHTLQERRNQARVINIMMYRIVNGLIAIPASLYLTYSTQSTRGHGPHGLRFHGPDGCVSAFNHSFFPATILTSRTWMLSVLTSTSCTPAMHDITQLWGFVHYWKTERARERVFMSSFICDPPVHPVAFSLHHVGTVPVLVSTAATRGKQSLRRMQQRCHNVNIKVVFWT